MRLGDGVFFLAAIGYLWHLAEAPWWLLACLLGLGMLLNYWHDRQRRR